MPDRFGVPDTMFGEVPDDFYALVGRIALVATLREDRVLTLPWSLANESQPTHAGLSASRLAPMILAHASTRATQLGEDLVTEIEATLMHVGLALEQRHALVHSLWPQPTLEAAQGWRSKRRPKREGGGSEIVWTRTLADELQQCLDELIRLTAVLLAVTNRVWGARTITPD